MSNDRKTRERIIETVIRLYSQHSYETISTKQIVEEVGISKGALYWHFTSKKDIFDEAFNRCYAKILEYSRIGIDESASAIDCLKRRLKNLLHIVKNDPLCVQVAGKYVSKHLDPDDGAYPYEELYNDIVKYVRKGLRNKEIVDLPESYLFHVCLDNVYSLAAYFRKHPEYYESELLIDKMIDSMHKSIQR